MDRGQRTYDPLNTDSVEEVDALNLTLDLDRGAHLSFNVYGNIIKRIVDEREMMPNLDKENKCGEESTYIPPADEDRNVQPVRTPNSNQPTQTSLYNGESSEKFDEILNPQAADPIQSSKTTQCKGENTGRCEDDPTHQKRTVAQAAIFIDKGKRNSGNIQTPEIPSFEQSIHTVHTYSDKNSGTYVDIPTTNNSFQPSTFKETIVDQNVPKNCRTTYKCSNAECNFITDDITEMKKHGDQCNFEVIYCKGRGCLYQNIRSDVRLHEKECIYKISHFYKGKNECRCSSKITDHEKNCPQSIYNCPTCNACKPLWELHSHITKCAKSFKCPNPGCYLRFMTKEHLVNHKDCFCEFRIRNCSMRSKGCNFQGRMKEITRHEMDECSYFRKSFRNDHSDSETRRKEEATDSEKFENQTERKKDQKRIAESEDLITVSDQVAQNLMEAAASIPPDNTGPTLERMGDYSRRDGIQITRNSRKKI